MPRSAAVIHRAWIAAPVDTVRARCAGLAPPIERNPQRRFAQPPRRPRGARRVQALRAALPQPGRCTGAIGPRPAPAAA